MNDFSRRSLMVATVLALALTARGQIRVGNDGRALDANTRVGSGGYNDPSPAFSNPSLGSQIITGNVTGGKQFRGYVPYTDPREFRGGYSSDSMDNFIKRSGGYSLTRTDNPNAPQAFYGGRLANPASSAFSSTGIPGTYIPSNRVDTQINPHGDTRLSPIQTGESIVLPSGDVVLAGPVDPLTNQMTLYTASPFMGIRSWNPADLGSLNASLTAGRYKLDDAEIAKFRKEINDSIDPGLSRLAPSALDAPGATLIQNDPFNNQVNADPLGASVAGKIPQPLLSPYLQSAQNAELEKRLNSYYSELLQTQDAAYARQLQELKSRMPSDNQSKPSAVAPDYQGIGQALPNAFPTLPDHIAPKTLAIDSLASGVTAPGLAQLLKQGEDLAREEKYEQAMETFVAASQVAPNNHLSSIGLAHAALGGGYFKKAEAAIRLAYTADPSLLMAKFNLKKMLGEQTLPNVVVQLKQAANAQQDDPGLALLLCYVSYHSNYASQAAIYLDLAEKRSKGKDPFYPYLRAHWKIETTAESIIPIPMETLLKQIDAKNVASLTLSDKTLMGSFRKPATVSGKPVLNFTSTLQQGAAGASTLKWIKENSQSFQLNLDN